MPDRPRAGLVPALLTRAFVLAALSLFTLALAVLSLLAPGARADEGMWTFDNLPTAQLQSKYHFAPTRAWLDHVRLSCVRFGDGGASGSFVSPDGLVLTCQHVALYQLQNIATPQKDYVADGLYARTRAEEIRCPGLELNVLTSFEDVTARMQGAARGKADADALKAREAEIARLTRESQAATGLKSQVVSLYNGGEYWLYRYKRYTDVRLVFAPEKQIAFFGGDLDNFTYPRYCLDFALFRVYDNGRPLRSPDYLKWDTAGAADGDLVLVAGYPMSTSRLDTMADILFRRDVLDPLTIGSMRRQVRVLQEYAAGGPEQARQVASRIYDLQNSLKSATGVDLGLHDPVLITKKQREESDLRARVARNPEWQREYGPAWAQIARALETVRPLLKRGQYRTLGSGSLAGFAGGIARYAAQVAKPDGQRLPGFHDADLPSLRSGLLASTPVYPALEERLMADALAQASGALGPDDLWVRTALGGRTPAAAAHALATRTRVADPAFRKALLDGGPAAITASHDPLIAVARALDPLNEVLTREFRDRAASVATAASEKIARARFAAYGRSTYPDATSTLRLAYGTVVGYPMNGTQAPAKTTLYGLYDRANGFGFHAPFDLPSRWAAGRDQLNLATPYDFVSDCDIIGGNSGSPVVDRDGALVGLIFDLNIEGLVGDYVHNGAQNRAVNVHPAAIIEALRKIYDAGPLADELEGKDR